MGAWYSHKCDNCDYEVHTEGPWEFYRDKNGIAGLTGRLYCSNCDKVSDIILVEFKKPTTDSMEVWGGIAEPTDDYQKEGAV